MIKTTHTYFCDVCDKEIPDGKYKYNRAVVDFDEDGDAYTEGWLMCKNCAISFQNWIAERKIKAKEEK